MRVFLLSLVLTACAAGQTSHSTDVRNVRWGMTRAQVRATERGTPKEEEGHIYAYEVTLGSLSAKLGFMFSEERGTLAKVIYIFTERHSNANTFLSDFESVDGLLKQKYGEPEVHRLTWSNELYKDDPTHYGMAVSAGHLQYASKWSTKTTIVFHWLTGDNFKIQHTIMYQPLNADDSESKAKTLKDY